MRERGGITPSKSDRLRLLSPAARKLIDRKAGYSDKALSASYSPQLINTMNSGIKTPNARSKSTPTSTPTHHHTPSLTDNLLNIGSSD